MMPRNWGKSRATLANIDRARAEGVDVALDIYPYPGSSTILIPERAEQIDDIRVTWSTPHPECAGRYPADIAADWGATDRGRAPAPSGRRDLFPPWTRTRCAASSSMTAAWSAGRPA